MAKKNSKVKAEKIESNPAEGHVLGDYLSSIRSIRRMTLREVEEASDNNVSNAYLSQLEKGKISKPSPNILRHLAQVYVVPYDTLMEKAGYFSLAAAGNDSLRAGGDLRTSRAEAFVAANLTEEEEASLLEYLAFLRGRKASKKG